MRITAEVEGAEAALETAGILDELAGAVSAFETREADGGKPALWRVEAYPKASILDAEMEIRLSLAAAGAGGAGDGDGDGDGDATGDGDSTRVAGVDAR